MNLIIAKNAGFCFGVKKAVDIAMENASRGEKAFSYGPLIHNQQVVDSLKNDGIGVINNIDDITSGDKIIIRSHGISKEEYEKIQSKGAIIEDATCPNVKYIHKIVEEKSKEGYTVIIVGDSEHPEIKGINGWCNNKAIIVNEPNDVYNINVRNKICVVAQTTYNPSKYFMLLEKIIRLSKQVLIFNTICNATQLRQSEAIEVSRKSDFMIVIGGKHSSNSRKLYEICQSECGKAVFIEGEDELDLDQLRGMNTIGITAGASTPDYIVEGVVQKIMIMENENTQDIEVKNDAVEVETMESMDNYDMYSQEVHSGKKVQGKVILVTDKEVYVDLGYKSDGLLPLSEASFEEINLKEAFKVGDEISAVVLKTNDGEGNVLLSRKAVERETYIEGIRKLQEEKTEIEITVVDTNKGGLNCKYGDIRAFMPLSMSGVHRDENPEELKGKKLPVIIAEIKERRGEFELIVSRKEIVRKEREAKLNEFFENVKEGDVLNGKIKSFIDKGAFVNVGALDVFVPISEIAWKRIGKPQDVLTEGSMTDVVVIRVNAEDKKITGSIKRTSKEPWEVFVEKYTTGDLVEGKVVRFAEFGAFVELMDGVDGLVHISNIADKHVNKPQDELKVGQMVEAKIIKLEVESRRVSLSLKESDKEAKPETTEIKAEETQENEAE